MAAKTFALSSREEVTRFESLLDQYVTARDQFPLKHISLTRAFDHLQQRQDGGRIFSALLDLQISFSLLYLDSHSVGATWSRLFSKGKLQGGSVLDSVEGFFGKMDIHRFNTSYVLRYRAVWDKIMGLMVMIRVPHEYDRFNSSKSRKRTFRKLALKYHIVDEGTVTKLEDLLTEFDGAFRTGEAHGVGVLRKYSFTMEPMDKNPQIDLLGYWNAVNGFVREIGRMLDWDPKKQP